MNSLLSRLTELGLPRKFIRDVVLPEWWDDSLADNEAGMAQGAAILANQLGIEIESVFDADGPLTVQDLGQCKFKKAGNVADEALLVPRTIATRAAQLACEATHDYAGLPTSAKEIREAILEEGAPWVDLESLLKYCWKVGVPVLNLRIPGAGGKVDGLAADVQGRPAIVLFKGHKYPSWHVFILAHELGHIACGHVARNSVLVDEDVNKAGASTDGEEIEANRFAIELLTGKPNSSFVAQDRWLNAAELASCAAKIGKERGIDPGHIVLNYAHSMDGFYAVGNAALNRLQPEADSAGQFRSMLADQLDWSSLTPECSEYLVRLSR